MRTVTVKVPAPFGTRFPVGTFEAVSPYWCNAGMVTSLVVSESGLSMTLIVEVAPDVGLADVVRFFGPNAQRVA